MLKGNLIHPQILSALGTAGHGATILIPDGNYPVVTGANTHWRSGSISIWRPAW